MGTAMDLLLASEKTVFTIDSSLRTITIPANVKNLGVASDDDVLRVYFTMPKTYCETDLSTFSIRINYLNAKGEPDLYKVTDATVEDNSIIFSWLIGRNAAAYKGNVTFNVCLKKIGDDDIVEKEFNTTIASLPILEGLETSEAVIQNNADYIAQLERQLSEQIENTVNEWCGEKLDETAMAQSVLAATKKELADASPDSKEVVDDLVSHVKDVPVTSADYAKISKIGGKTRKTKNLFDTAPIGTKTFIGLTYTSEDGYVKINGTKINGANIHIMTAPNMTLPAGTYTVSVRMVSGTVTGIEANGGVFFGINQNTYGQRTTPGVSKVGDVGVRTFTLSEPTLVSSFDIAPDYASVGAVFDNAVFACQFEQANTATEYEPYFDDLRSAPVPEVESVGANLIPYPYHDTTKTVHGITYTDNGDGSLTLNGTATDAANFYMAWLDEIQLKPNTDYYFNCGVTIQGLSMVMHFSQSEVGGSFRTDSNSTLHYCVIQVLSGTTLNNVTIYPMLNEGTEALSYRPYQRNTLPIPEAVQALDGYGDGVNESVYNYIDFEKKQFVKRVGKVDLGTLDWALEERPTLISHRFHAALYDAPQSFDINLNVLCSKYTAADAPITYGDIDKTISLYDGQVYLLDGTEAYTDVATFKTAMSGVMLYYELATPEIIDISDLLSADNILPVEGGGTLTMVNEYEYDVPNEVTFYTDSNDYYIGSRGFVGNLIGTAARAESDVDGNPIPTTYAKKGDSMVDASANRVKTVPENSASYAKVNEIGGLTRKCTNLIKSSVTTNDTAYGISYTVKSDGSITLNGTATQNMYLFIADVEYSAEKAYFLSGCPSGYSGESIILYDDTNSMFDYGSGCVISFAETTPGKVYIRVTSGTTLNNATVCPMLNEGSTALPYEPYFDGLRSAAVTEVESVGVNLLPSLTQTRTVAGITYSPTADGGVHIEGTATSVSVCVLIQKTMLAGDYSFIGLNVDAVNNGLHAQFGWMADSGNWESVNIFNASVHKNLDTTRMCLYQLVVSTGATVNHTIYPTINEGTEALSYRPYQRNTLPIPEAVQALDGYGDGVNESVYNYIDFEKKQFVKRVGRVVLNGSEYWDGYTTSDSIRGVGYCYRCRILGKKTAAMSVCSHFNNVYKAWDYGTIGDYYDSLDNNLIYFVSDKATLTEWIASLTSTPVTLVYELATPEIIDISIGDALGVEPGGTVTLVNEHDYDLPNKLTFYTEPNKFRVGSEGFVGDLIGTASRAVCDGEGNDINKTYVKNQSDSFILKSATKLWRITVNDSGTITATEVT